MKILLKEQKNDINSQHQEQNPNKGRRGDFTRNYNYKRNEVVQNNKTFKLKNILKGNLSDIYGD